MTDYFEGNAGLDYITGSRSIDHVFGGADRDVRPAPEPARGGHADLGAGAGAGRAVDPSKTALER